MFRRFLHPYMSVQLLHRDFGMWIISEEYDFTALCAALFSVLILCCNLRVRWGGQTFTTFFEYLCLHFPRSYPQILRSIHRSPFQVVGTVSLCLVIVAILMTASCTMVGFFHADPQNWIDAQFFRFGFDGVSSYLILWSNILNTNGVYTVKKIRKITALILYPQANAILNYQHSDTTSRQRCLSARWRRNRLLSSFCSVFGATNSELWKRKRK